MRPWILLWLLLAGCQARPAATPTPTPTHTMSDMSLYHTSSKWVDQDGQSLKLEDLRGRPVVLALVYTSCQGACPRIVEDIKKIEAALPAHQASFVLVSIDPEVDTPEQLREYAREHRLGPDWRLLQGAEDDVRELAALLTFKYRKSSTRDYAHSNLITVLSPTGEIVHQQEGLGVDPAASLAAIKAR